MRALVLSIRTRRAALTAFRLPPASFVGTATAIGLMVDLARTPVYVWSIGDRLPLSGRR